MLFRKRQSLLKSFHSGFRGVGHALKERNFFLQTCIGILVLILGVIFQLPIDNWIVLILLIGLVLGSEMINTSLEYLLDLLIPHHHETVAKIKKLWLGRFCSSPLLQPLLPF